MVFKAFSILCLLTGLVSAQDMYIGPYEAEAQFDSISMEKVARIRQQRILFAGRSWSGALANSYEGNLGSEYRLNYKPRLNFEANGTDSIPANIFSSPGVVHLRQPDLTPGRWKAWADAIRGRNGSPELGLEIDIAFQFLYNSSNLIEDYLPLFDSLRQEYPDVKFGICTHHVASDSTNNAGWNIGGNEYSDSVLSNYLGEIPVLDIRMIAAIGDIGDTATFEYQGKTWYQMHQDYTSGDNIHLQDYTTLCKAWYMMLDHLTPDTGYYDTTGIPIDSGMINVYVDPTAFGTGDGSSWDNAYTSLAAAELMQRADLVTLDASITFNCRGGVDNDGVKILSENWTVDADHFITVEVAPGHRHDGTRGTGYIVTPQAYQSGIHITVPYTVLNGVAVQSGRSSKTCIQLQAEDCVIINCLAYEVPGIYYSGIQVQAGSNGAVLANNIVYDCIRTGIDFSGWSGAYHLYNNTVLNCTRALRAGVSGSATLQVTNCYFGSVTGDSVISGGSSGGVTFTNTHTSTGEYGTIQTALATDAGTYFASVDSGAEDVQITEPSDLYATGADLGADPVFPLQLDAAGVYRNEGAFSVGAYEVNINGPFVSTPVISPAGGSHVDSVEVTITCATSGAGIYYTTDGSDPDTGSMLYAGPFTLTATATVKALGAKSGATDSYIASRTYTITAPAVAEPVISPDGGSFSDSQAVTISCGTADADIYYTTDGTTPTATATEYTGTFTLTASATVKAIGIKSGMEDSPVATAAFTQVSAIHDVSFQLPTGQLQFVQGRGINGMIRLDAVSDVRIELFDMQGRHRATIQDGVMKAGTYGFTYEVTVGLYLVRTMVNGVSGIQKVFSN